MATKLVKEVEFAERKFTANGRTFHIETSMVWARWRVWRELKVKLAYDTDFPVLQQNLRNAYDLLNQRDQKPIDAGVIIYNIMHGIAEADDPKRAHPAMQMCALFMNTDDEDRTVYDPIVMQKKIDDWNAEGISMESFFVFAIASIHNFMPNYESIIRDTSSNQKQAGESLNMKMRS